jgi:disease resistance protein RPS2
LEQVVQETANEVDKMREGIEQSTILRSGRTNGFSEEQEIQVEGANNEHLNGYQNKMGNERIKGMYHLDFPKLRTVVLTDLPKLTAICNPRDFPYLEIIRVEGCPHLTTLPLGQMYDCPKLKQICGSYDWWEKLEWNVKEIVENNYVKEIMENKYFIPIKDVD